MKPRFPLKTEKKKQDVEKAWEINAQSVLVGIIFTILIVATILTWNARESAQTELQPTVAPTCAPCEPLPTGDVGPLDVDGAEYQFVAIGDMPCVIAALDYGNRAVLGFTCDWSRWEGNQDE